MLNRSLKRLFEMSKDCDAFEPGDRAADRRKSLILENPPEEPVINRWADVTLGPWN
jgi:hypothetical protein